MNNQNDVVIVSAVRTPFSKFGGALKEIHSTDLGVIVINESLKRAGMTGEDLDEVYYGMCDQAEAALYDNVNARQAILRAGLPSTLVSLTLDRACCSSLCAVQLGRRAILLNEADACMAVGAENMSNTPLLINGHRWGSGMKPLLVQDYLNPITYREYTPLGRDAGEIAIEHGISREEQDAWALGSHQKWDAADKAGLFYDELVSVELPAKKGTPVIFGKDELPRPDTTLEALARLKTIYGSPTVTAGNAPGLDAGATAVIIMRRSKAEKLGIRPLATIVAVASGAGEPRRMAELPAKVIAQALKRASLCIDDMSVIEINEAFAAVTLVSTKMLAGGDEAKWRELLKKTNPNGGAIAIGHPVGASGGRILMTMMYELKRRGGGYGICGICGGLAQGDAVVIRVD
ncbi:MAG TPA: thiolase family protein [Smithella sp.]|jgi:acetyl-CoA C-acetyltransferase|nr:thiolase family protein [Smithella sp.]HOG09355.1 thiolase family protein [Smithella sp.]HOO34642.1 thiolase family protein [Smithella sp.]HOS13107.1 thiolase family protein [Smithella sp.]HPC08630.1 thiolase family protein [Smithella sp.]